MTTVGEPIEPEVWRWYRDVVGKGEAVIVDTWWQTENGGFLGATLPALEPMKAGSCGPGVLGVYPVIYDEQGEVVPAGSGKAGNICIRNPWPGIFQTIWGQPERFVQIYYEKYNRNPDSKDWRDWPYFAGDGAVQAADGYFRILGRVDDVINVAGHRLGTKELESAALTVDEIAEAAAVPVVDEIRGRAVEMYVSLKPGVTGRRRHRAQGRPGHRQSHRQDRSADARVDRPRHAQDPVRKDHAPGHRGDFQLRGRGGHHHVVQPGDCRQHPPPGAGRESCPRAKPPRADPTGGGGDQTLWERRVANPAGSPGHPVDDAGWPGEPAFRPASPSGKR